MTGRRGRPSAPYDIATGNDADSDRHGIVTPDAGLMNPNHYLAVAIRYLYGGARPGLARRRRDRQDPRVLRAHRPGGRGAGPDAARGAGRASSGSSPACSTGSVGFGGEESAGASFLRTDGTVWTTDKDGILLALLASEITARPASRRRSTTRTSSGSSASPGTPGSTRPATLEEKSTLGKLSPEQVTATELAGEPITARLTAAPGNGASIGGLKVTTENAWFAARPSGTENVYKIYAESFVSAEHLARVQSEARDVVSSALGCRRPAGPGPGSAGAGSAGAVSRPGPAPPRSARGPGTRGGRG